MYALELERHYSKAQILEAYLNLAPYGRNIEGVGAASEIYFAKTAARISGPEAVALSVIPQSPTRRALINHRENERLTAAQQRWYTRAGEQETPAADLSRRSARQVSADRAAFRPKCSEVQDERHRIADHARPFAPANAGETDSGLCCAKPPARHRKRRRAAHRFPDDGGPGPGRLLGFFQTGNPRPGRRHAPAALAGLDLEAVCLRARARSGADSSPHLVEGRAAQLRRLQSGEFRSRLSWTDPGVGCAGPQPERSRRHPRVGIIASDVL